MDRQMRSHGVPKEIWTDGGPPYNGHEWREYVEDWGSKPKRTTPYHPPANGMVERFNQVLKQTILAAYADRKDPVEEVDKVVSAYRNTPHTVTKVKPSKLMFNRDIATKLPRFTSSPRGRHHTEARANDKEAKELMKDRYDTKHRTRLVEIKVGDFAYIRRNQTSTTKATWDPIPYQITEVVHNKITGMRHGDEKTRDRGDWKLMATRPAHLQAFTTHTRTVTGPQPTNQDPTGWDTTENNDDDWPDDDGFGRRPNTRAEKARRAAQQAGPTPVVRHIQQQQQQPAPRLPAIQEEEETDGEEESDGEEEPMGFGLFDQVRPINQLRRQVPVQRQPILQPRRERAVGDVPPTHTRDGDVPPKQRDTHDGDASPAGGENPPAGSRENSPAATCEGDAPPSVTAHARGDASPADSAGTAPRLGGGEKAPAATCDRPLDGSQQQRDRHKCPSCGILLKLYNGRRLCPCGRSGAPTLDINRTYDALHALDPDTGEDLGQIAYARGLTSHPLADSRPEVRAIEVACQETGILMSPSDASSSDTNRSEDGDIESSSSSCHGFTPSPDTPDHYSDIDQDPEYAVILHTIRMRQRLHERLTSTREDFADGDEDIPEGAAAAPHPAIQEEDVLHHAPTTPPHELATPNLSPIHFELRSGRVKQGAPRKRGRGTRARR